ncbi:glycoside hydrolase family 2 [Pedobacter sp. SD-b]|uniref:beta-galactosidase n=1 Tax=Pedobacter segetis TaxID=2793069 RepID=A0ABS1BPG8_9SPHI|nr:glycoside hydrolase family 2 TIM barrel-domain containing protein [Pedobacter segetis]MBK0384341.1 glycoside hydrolase family 2 [Pedobacter segetis]
MKSKLVLLSILSFFYALAVQAQQTEIKYLSGLDKDHTVTWDFLCTKGMNSGKWSKIQVPSCWELQGFGNYDYGKTDLVKQADEQGFYKYKFKVDNSWKGKLVNIVFDGSMTDTEVKINGKPAGKIHQGAFYRFKYNISSLLKYGQTNLLEVKVSKKSQNLSVNQAEREADFWIFGGIFRPVYLEALPQSNIERIAVDAKANGDFMLSVYPKSQIDGYKLEAVVKTSDGSKNLKTISETVNARDTLINLESNFKDIQLWSPEFPNLYWVEVNLINEKGKTVHSINQKFGFRTVELRPKDGFYLNNQKVIFKGVNRHSFWPTSGRTTSKALSITDVEMMKDMNMNAVRMSHYPPDVHFLDVCDSLGLMVLDELTGWHNFYDDSIGHRLVKEMVIRDVNHPSIVIWDNGNEGGFNFNLDDDFAKYDPQNRIVIHPWAKFRGTDTKHYPTYNALQNNFIYNDDVFFPTEFLHGLYDGGHGAGLEDFWDVVLKYPNAAGGFLWVFADEGVVRKDKKDSLDAAGNFAPDGILGPYHEKEGSYYTIKEIWSPVYINQKNITSTFNGQLPVENRYMFTNLNQCKFTWKLASFNNKPDSLAKQIDATGGADNIDLSPNERGWLNLKLPENWMNSDVLYVTAKDPHNKEIFTWSWPIKTAKDLAKKWIVPTTAQAAISVSEEQNLLQIKQDNITLIFNKTTGYLQKVVKAGKDLSLSEGPVLAGFDQKLDSFSHKQSGENYTVSASYKGKDNDWLKVDWTFKPGLPVKLEYSYRQNEKKEVDYAGITFNYPEEKITGMQYLGRGPYHVYKNRLKGQRFDLWDKKYNNTITGEIYEGYPEFKGNHAEVYWVQIENKEFPFKVYTEQDHVFLQMLKTEKPKGAFNKNTDINYPKGNLGFMDYIPPIGTKFHGADEMGPEGQKNNVTNKSGEVSALWFDFR